MAIERLWEEIPARSLSADGQPDGSITLESTIHFRTNQKIKLTALGEDTLTLVVKRVTSPTQMILGPNDKNILSRTNLSAYTLAKIAMVRAAEQNKTGIPEKDQLHMTLEREPVNARRVYEVDDFGNAMSKTIVGEVSVLDVNEIPDFTTTPLYDNITVNNTATLLRIGATNLKGRRVMIIQPKGKSIYIGWDNGLTSGNAGNGLKVSSNSVMYLSVSEGVDVYAITSGGNSKVHVTEGK